MQSWCYLDVTMLIVRTTIYTDSTYQHCAKKPTGLSHVSGIRRPFVFHSSQVPIYSDLSTVNRLQFDVIVKQLLNVFRENFGYISPNWRDLPSTDPKFVRKRTAVVQATLQCGELRTSVNYCSTVLASIFTRFLSCYCQRKAFWAHACAVPQLSIIYYETYIIVCFCFAKFNQSWLLKF